MYVAHIRLPAFDHVEGLAIWARNGHFVSYDIRRKDFRLLGVWRNGLDITRDDMYAFAFDESS